MAPVVHGLESEYTDRIAFSYIDVDDTRAAWLKSELGYRVQPHLFLVESDGTIVDQWFGFTSRDTLIKSFEAVLAEEDVR